MMQSICGSDCCAVCPQKAACGVCVAAACVEQGGLEELDRWKRAAIAELNALNIPDLKSKV